MLIMLIMVIELIMLIMPTELIVFISFKALLLGTFITSLKMSSLANLEVSIF